MTPAMRPPRSCSVSPRLALAQDGDRLPDRFGSLTPAVALGEVLVERLREAGHIYQTAPG